MTMLTTEDLLCSPAGFALISATNVQRAACRIGDGLPLGDLADDPEVVAMVGGTQALALLPSVPPVEVIDVSSPRTAKTMRACARAARATQIVDVSGLAPGEKPRLSLVALTVDGANVALDLLGGLLSRPALRPLVVESDRDSFTLRHPSGRPIEIKVTAGARFGGNLVSRWSAGVVFDEAPRMNGEEDGVINLDHARSAVIDRLLPGAQIQEIGSPWAPRGTIYDAVQKDFGKPSIDRVVMRIVGPAANPTHWTTEFCARLRRQDPNAWRVGVLGEFVDPVTGMFSATAIDAATRSEPAEIHPLDARARRVAAIDPSEAGSGNAFTLVICDRDPDDRRVRVVLAHEWRKCGPEAALSEIAFICGRYGINTALTDDHAPAALQAIASHYGLALEVRRSTATTKLEQYGNVATLLATGELELAPVPQLTRDLLIVRKRTTLNGFAIELPRTADGRHADYAPALASAVSELVALLEDPDEADRKILSDPTLVARHRAALGSRYGFSGLAGSNSPQSLLPPGFGFGWFGRGLK